MALAKTESGFSNQAVVMKHSAPIVNTDPTVQKLWMNALKNSMSNEFSPKMIRGSSSQTAASRKSRNGAMIPPKSHKPEQSETPKFL